MPLDTALAGDMEEVKQDFIPVDTADDGEMEGNPDISLQADEGSPSILIQADECNPSISASPNILAQADKDSHNISVIANEDNPTPNPCTSIQADLSPNPKNPIQENVDPMEESQQDEKTVSAYSSHNDADEASCNPSYTSGSNCNPNDIVLANSYVEFKPTYDTDEVKETVQAGGNTEDADLTDANLNDASQANDNPDNAVLANGKPNEKVQADEQMISVDIESCEEAVFNAQLEEGIPWKEEFVIDPFSAGTEPEEGNRRSSLKRPRLSCFDNTPSVQVIYNCLTRESKNKLKELLRLWAEWHGECVGSKEEIDRESLESGDEMYFPALQVGGGSKATMSFWMDKPSKHAHTENATVELTPVNLDREKEVPLYDRAGTGALISQETETSIEGSLECVDEGSRCFNCGSYSHSLKECPRPRDNAAIVNARNLLAEKRGSGNGFRVPSRYYQNSRCGKFDDLKPGFLGSETRQLLGIGELDPPPWLNRMRELGYPPGYLEDQEDEPSGITIFGTSEDGAEGSFIGEDGEIIGEYMRKQSISKKMKVCFPGVNAPIPDDADQHTWGSPADFSGHGRSSYRVMGRTGHSSSFSAAALTSDGIVYTGSDDWEGPPGTGHDSYLKGSKVRSPSYEGVSVYSKTSPWQPNEQGRPGKVASGRSPHLGRSSSDSGRRSPKVSYDEPHTLPPLGGLYSGSRQSPMHSLRPYQSPSTPNQRSPYGQEYREDVLESRRRAWAQAHDALQSMHRSDRHSPSRRR